MSAAARFPKKRGGAADAKSGAARVKSTGEKRIFEKALPGWVESLL